MRFLGAIGGGLLWMLSAGTALAINLACITDNPSSRDWMPTGVLVSIEEGSYQAIVLDDFTAQVLESGAFARITRPTQKRIQLDWKLVGVRDSQDRLQNVSFKMTLNLARGTFNYSGVGESNFQTPGSARGRCAVVKEK